MEAMGRLAGGIAHDFNNLLTVINGYSYLLRIDVGPESPLHQRLDEIHKAGQRAAELTQQLLAFSRKQLLQMKVLNLNAMITESAKILGRLIGEDVELILDLDPALGSVRADAGQIHQVLINLAVNARDAMPAGGKLVLTSANVVVKDSTKAESAGVPPGNYMLLTVTDTGSGMSAEAQAHLFEPFFTTKAQGQGTGLGLSIVYGIVRQSGGFVSVSSAADKGTSVRIFLPVAEAAVSVGAGPIHPDPVRGSETVLLVEDQEQVRELAAVILKELGYHVLEAANADDALLLGASHDGPIHVLLTDVLMPGMTGCALADRLRPARPEMNVIYMSGYADRETVDEAIQRPDALFLQKPFTSETLAVKIREALQSTRTNLATHRASAGPTPAF
jgi:CheY-like chemotaxis protein